MTVSDLTLEDFTAFREAKLPLAAGINVFLGANATGKTHAMKAMYASLRALAEPEPPSGLDVLLKESLPQAADLLRRSPRSTKTASWSTKTASWSTKTASWSTKTASWSAKTTSWFTKTVYWSNDGSVNVYQDGVLVD